MSGAPRFMDTDVPTLLARLAHALERRRHARVLKGGADLNGFHVLAALHDAGARGMRVGPLAALCMLQQPTMTKLLDRFEGRGLIERTREARDRRGVVIRLTPEGALLAEDLVRAAQTHARALAEAAPSLEVWHLAQALAEVEAS
jgi:MarR family transcriptional regulator, organic hydroperoxide resistance regulator